MDSWPVPWILEHHVGHCNRIHAVPFYTTPLLGEPIRSVAVGIAYERMVHMYDTCGLGSDYVHVWLIKFIPHTEKKLISTYIDTSLLASRDMV